MSLIRVRPDETNSRQLIEKLRRKCVSLPEEVEEVAVQFLLDNYANFLKVNNVQGLLNAIRSRAGDYVASRAEWEKYMQMVHFHLALGSGIEGRLNFWQPCFKDVLNIDLFEILDFNNPDYPFNSSRNGFIAHWAPRNSILKISKNLLDCPKFDYINVVADNVKILEIEEGVTTIDHTMIFSDEADYFGIVLPNSLKYISPRILPESGYCRHNVLYFMPTIVVDGEEVSSFEIDEETHFTMIDRFGARFFSL